MKNIFPEKLMLLFLEKCSWFFKKLKITNCKDMTLVVFDSQKVT